MSPIEVSSGLGRSAHLSPEVRRALGGLLPLVDDPGVRDLMVHAHDGVGHLFVDRGAGAERMREWSVPETAVNRLAISLIAAGGRHLDELNPCADVRLGDGIRVHSVLAPVAASGSAISIRLPREHAASFPELVGAGLCAPHIARFLEGEVAGRRNLLITGGTGSGKTTLLTALLSLVPADERIITIEDVAELRPLHGHHVALESRQANIEGAGEVSLERLLREALRMRPDRLVLGECRGVEIKTLLSALNTGHDGGAGTLHANRLEDVPARLEALGLLADLPVAALARQTVSALHTVVHVGRQRGVHRIEQVGRFRLGSAGQLEVETHDVDRLTDTPDYRESVFYDVEATVQYAHAGGRRR
ncbi:MAG: CpaF family protein [Leucobacter sp.]